MDILARTPLRALLVLLLCGTMAGCAAGPTEGQYAEPPVSRYCKNGKILSCFERIGKTVRCVCEDKTTLEDLLDPYSE